MKCRSTVALALVLGWGAAQTTPLKVTHYRRHAGAAEVATWR